MRNIYWYIGLAVIGIIIAAFTIYRNRDRYNISTLLAFYFFTACVTWIGEFMVLGLLDAYAYKTGIFEDPWKQNLLGHLLVNTTLYPAVSIVMVAYSLRYGWILSVAVCFTSIEIAFVNLRIYEQHWWRYYMTFAAVIIFLTTFKKWFSKMLHKPFGLVRATTFYFISMLITHIPAPVLLLLDKQHYKLDIVNNYFGNPYLSSIVIIFTYHLIESLLLVLCTCILKKWYWKLLPVIFSIAVQTLFYNMGILVLTGGWKLGYTLLVYEIFIAIYILFEKYALKPDLRKARWQSY